VTVTFLLLNSEKTTRLPTAKSLMFKQKLLNSSRLDAHCDCMSQHVRIQVRLPEGHWSGDVSRSLPSLVLRIEETMPLGKGRGTATLSASDDVELALEAHPGIDEVRSLGNQRFAVDIASGGGGFVRPLRIVGVVPRSPFEVHDGWVDWTFVCTPEQARQLLTELTKEGIPYRLTSTRNSGATLLTSRQRQIFDAALREGYYDVPRRTSLSKLAVAMDMAKSTLSAMLQRIESRIMNDMAEEIRRKSP
jgi:predicted DNA binding protein